MSTAGTLGDRCALPRPVRSMVEAPTAGREKKRERTLAKDDSASRSAKSTRPGGAIARASTSEGSAPAPLELPTRKAACSAAAQDHPSPSHSSGSPSPSLVSVPDGPRPGVPVPRPHRAPLSRIHPGPPNRPLHAALELCKSFRLSSVFSFQRIAKSHPNSIDRTSVTPVMVDTRARGLLQSQSHIRPLLIRGARIKRGRRSRTVVAADFASAV